MIGERSYSAVEWVGKTEALVQRAKRTDFDVEERRERGREHGGEVKGEEHAELQESDASDKRRRVKEEEKGGYEMGEEEVQRIDRGTVGVDSGELVGGRDSDGGAEKPKYDFASALNVDALLAAEWSGEVLR